MWERLLSAHRLGDCLITVATSESTSFCAPLMGCLAAAGGAAAAGGTAAAAAAFDWPG